MSDHDPMKEGMLAALNGKARSSRRYKADSDEYAEWMEGVDHVESTDEDGELLEE